MDAAIDQSTAVRIGEELDLQKLRTYLQEHLPGSGEDLTIQQFPSGFSNLTYLIKLGENEFVLRKPPIGAQIKTAHDMGREFRILTQLQGFYPKVPRPILYCQDDSILGAPFYLMERVKGVILRSQPPRGMELGPAVMRRLSETFVDSLVEIHQIDFAAAGLADLGSPRGYVNRQLGGWTRRYYNAKTSEVEEIENIVAWLSANAPADSPEAALIHNDYKYDNLVLAADDLTRVLAVLDWEMATIGDPLMDLGTTIGYWVESTDRREWQQYGFVLTALPGNFTRNEIVERYVTRRGREIGNPVFYYVFGLLKIAVIVQQIFFRYQRGITKDPRFASLGTLVQACGQQAQRAIETNRLGRLG